METISVSLINVRFGYPHSGQACDAAPGIARPTAESCRDGESGAPGVEGLAIEFLRSGSAIRFRPAQG